MANNASLSEADIPQLLQLLQGALSPDAPTQKQAEAVLASIEGRIGYCSCLAVSTCYRLQRSLHKPTRTS
jgi:hypothetical protein